MRTERIVITGVGIVGPHGARIEPIFAASPQSSGVFTPWPEDVQRPHADAVIARVADYPARRFFTDRQLRMMDRAMSLSSTAVGLALEDAQLGEAQRREACTFLGTARAELPSCYNFIQPHLGGKGNQLNAADFPKIARNVSCGQVAIRYGMQGPSTVLASGSLASLEALMRASNYIRSGRARVAVVGGYESLSRFSLYFLSHLHGEHQEAVRPQFFGETDGFLVPSEGACMLILEAASHAVARGAKIYCSVDSWIGGRVGLDQDPAEVLTNAWKSMGDQAGVLGSEVGIVVASSGGARRRQEVAETEALARFVNEYSNGPQIYAPRAAVGEGETWASALQIAIAAQAIVIGKAPSMSVSPDAMPLFRRSTKGGPLPHPSALVTGVGTNFGYSAIRLSKF